MGWKVKYIMVIGGLCFSQSPALGLEPVPYGNSFSKAVSLELFAGVHFTFAYQMEFRAMTLPDYMIHGGFRVAYLSSRHIVWSCAGSYSRASDLAFRWIGPFIPPVLDFVCLCADFSISYANRITGKSDYFIGAGFDISQLIAFQYDITASNDDTTFSSTYVRPLIDAGLKFNISRRIFSQIRAGCYFHYLFKTGEEHIHLNDISPSMSLGIGCTLQS